MKTERQENERWTTRLLEWLERRAGCDLKIQNVLEQAGIQFTDDEAGEIGSVCK